MEDEELEKAHEMAVKKWRDDVRNPFLFLIVLVLLASVVVMALAAFAVTIFERIK